MDKKKNILFSGGGTLGHIYPMVSVVEELSKKYNLFFIGTTKGLERDFIEKLGKFKKTYYLDSEGIKRKLTLKNIIVVLKHFRNIGKVKKIIRNENIDLVIGMGGYISASTVGAAIKLKVKTMIHEQNSVYGLANKILHKKVDKVLLTYNIDNSSNTVLVGNPRITEIYEKYKNTNLGIKDYLLVVGGSRGAARINEFIISLKDQFINSNINLLLITGKKYYTENIDLINEVKDDRFKIIDFTDDLPKYLIEARVVISRAGATTIAEIMALKKITLFIPSPNVTNNHQEKNALEILKFGGGEMLRESGITKEILFDTIYKLYYNKDIRNRIINNIICNIDTNSSNLFIYEVEKLLLTGKNNRK